MRRVGLRIMAPTAWRNLVLMVWENAHASAPSSTRSGEPARLFLGRDIWVWACAVPLACRPVACRTCAPRTDKFGETVDVHVVARSKSAKYLKHALATYRYQTELRKIPNT